MSEDLFPSGPWLGFYTYAARPDRHRMSLSLTFANGNIAGEGDDDLDAFIIRGRYDAITKECHWTKSYVGKHDVFYQGFREGKGIWGVWAIGAVDRGGFKIWPMAYGEGDDDAETDGREEPVDAVGELVGVGARVIACAGPAAPWRPLGLRAGAVGDEAGDVEDSAAECWETLIFEPEQLERVARDAGLHEQVLDSPQ